MHRNPCPRALLFFALAAADGFAMAEPPNVKPGLWEVVAKDAKTGAVQTSTTCISKESQDFTRQLAQHNAQNADGPCKIVVSAGSSSSSSHSVVSECTYPVATWRTISTTTASADLIHTVEHTQLIKGDGTGLPGDQESDMRFKGVCPAGMEGGDTILPDGSKVNMMKMLKK